MKFWKTLTWAKIQTLIKEYGNEITPHPSLIFRPLMETPLDKVKVVFVFPEPYATAGLANGLGLSFNPIKDSQKGANGFDFAPLAFYQLMSEYCWDLKARTPPFDLTPWAERGVLLWNSRLTTLKDHALGNLSWGWPLLTKEIIETVYLQDPKTVFVFFGTYPMYQGILPEDAEIINLSELSAINNPVSGSNLFSKINEIRKANRQKKINWYLS